LIRSGANYAAVAAGTKPSKMLPSGHDSWLLPRDPQGAVSA